MSVFNCPITWALSLLHCIGLLSIQVNCALLTDHSSSLGDLNVLSITSGSNNRKTVELNWTNPSCLGSCASTVYYWLKDEHETDAKKELAHDDTRYQVVGLLPWTMYVFQVKSCFVTTEEPKVEKCLQSKKVEFRTQMGTPSEIPTFTASFIHANSIALVWEQPETPNGPISGYSLFQMESEHWTVSRNENNLQIFNLKPYTTYVFHISAFNLDPSETPNRMKLNGPGKSLTIETKYGIPSECQYLRVRFESYTSVRVFWDQPLTPNGLIDGYLLRYSLADNPSQILGTQDISQRTNTTVEKLDYYTNYTFEVQAYNNPNDGSRQKLKGPFSRVTHRTDPWLPSEPQNVKIVGATSKNLNIEWSKPLHPNGPIDEYIIEAKRNNPLDQSEKDIIDMGSVRTTFTNYTLDYLIPWREYKITIKAVNLDERINSELESKGVDVYGSTRIGVPLPPRNVKMQKKGPKTISVSWNTSAPKTGPTIYLVYLDQQKMDSNLDCFNDNCWKLKTRTNMLEGWDNSKITFDDVEPMSRYRARVVSQTEAGYERSEYSDELEFI